MATTAVSGMEAATTVATAGTGAATVASEKRKETWKDKMNNWLF